MFVCVWGAIYSSVLRCLQGVVCVLLELCAFVGLTVFAGCLRLASLCKCVYSRIGVVQVAEGRFR